MLVNGILRVVTVILLVLLSGWLLLQAVAALDWRMIGDAPVLMYAAWLVSDCGYVPYRDVYEINMPGTYLLYMAVGRGFGYSDAGLQRANLLFVALLGLCTWCLLRPLGRGAAWAAAVIGLLSYYAPGPYYVMQRDIVVLVPLLAAALLLLPDTLRRPRTVFLAAGALLGVVAAVKPHLALSYPLYLLLALRHGRHALWLIPAGTALPLLALAAWLAAAGALPALREVWFGYYPLHLGLTHGHETIAGFARVRYLWTSLLRLGGHTVWLLPALLGFYHAWLLSPQPAARRRLLFLCCLAGAYLAYPLIPGRFFPYHWLPGKYLLVMLGALTLVPVAATASAVQRLLPPLALLITLLIALRPAPEFAARWRGEPAEPARYARVRAMTVLLRDRLRPGDTVQPLDTVMGGAANALLRTRARLATPLLYDFQLYLFISQPQTQLMRGRFLHQLQAAAPRFVLEITEDKPWFTGADTTREFPALRAQLAAAYDTAAATPDFVLYERRPAAR